MELTTKGKLHGVERRRLEKQAMNGRFRDIFRGAMQTRGAYTGDYIAWFEDVSGDAGFAGYQLCHGRVKKTYLKNDGTYIYTILADDGQEMRKKCSDLYRNCCYLIERNNQENQ